MIDKKLPDILPSSISEDNNIKAIATAINNPLEQIKNQIHYCVLLSDIDHQPEKIIDELAWHFHVDFYDYELPLEKKRSLVKQSIAIHRRKGTPWAVEQVVSTAFDKSDVIEWFDYDADPFLFKVRTEDVTTNREIIDKMKKAINSVKNTRSWLDKIEFVLHFIDDLGEIKDKLHTEVNYKIDDVYPWNYQKYDGTYQYGGPSVYSGIYSYDGSLKYDRASLGCIYYNAAGVDKMSVMTAKLKGYEDNYQTAMYYDGHNLYNGVQRYSQNNGPQDDGGEIRISKGRHYNGKCHYDGGIWELYDGNEKYDSSMHYNGGDKVIRYQFTERNERF